MTEEQFRTFTVIALILTPVLGLIGVALTVWVNFKINRVEKNVDGKLTDLLAAREDAAGAHGQLKERDAQREHVKATQPVISTDDDPFRVELVKGKDSVEVGAIIEVTGESPQVEVK